MTFLNNGIIKTTQRYIHKFAKAGNTMFADNLKQLRKAHGLSQDKLASVLNKKYDTNISKSMLSRWENNVTDPQMKYVRLIADYFGVSTELISDQAENSTNNTGLSVDEAVDHLSPYQGKPISDDQKAIIKDLIKGYLDRSNKE